MKIISMIIIMILSGLFSVMSIWSDKLKDVRLSLNDIFMISLMTGWMIFFMGIIYKNFLYFITGLSLVLLSIFSIRKQIFVTEKQYIKGMIPHHSMAIMMSKKLKEKQIQNPQLKRLVDDIIKNQREEIEILKQIENL